MKPKVCAVSYLNTTPLVWGLLHGPQREALDLRFEIPSVCAELLRTGEVDIGLVPTIELDRQPLEMIPGLGIASRGPVRSILLISKKPAPEIETLALDASSRTSVALARILLEKRFGARPTAFGAPPDPLEMLRKADACLVIGDPALRVQHGLLAEYSYDLGEVWSAWTGLPMVYAVWAARAGFEWPPVRETLRASWEYGHGRIGKIAATEGPRRGISEELAYEYLTRIIRFELGADEERGLERYRALSRELNLV